MVNSSVVSAYNMDDYCYIQYGSLGMDYRENMSKTACLQNNNNNIEIYCNGQIEQYICHSPGVTSMH